MKNIIIDTCVIIHIIRESETGKKCLLALGEFDAAPTIIISVVTKAEIESFSRQNKWGEPRLKKLNEFIRATTIIDIYNTDKLLMDAYVETDGYSKRKLTDKKGNLLPGSAKKMGKNDLWIAATAGALNIPLMTADKDFDHLNHNILNVMRVK